MIRVQIPYHLQNLAQTTAEVQLEVAAPVTPLSVIRTLEARFPTLRGAIIEHNSNKRRPLIRFFACQQDISHDNMETPLATPILEGREPFIILGAIAGG